MKMRNCTRYLAVSGGVAFASIAALAISVGVAGAQVNSGSNNSSSGGMTIIQPDFSRQPDYRQPDYPQPKMTPPPPVVIPPPANSATPPTPSLPPLQQ